MAVDCKSDDCVVTNSTDSSNGLPYLILIITLVLCSILLATIALIIIVVITRDRRRKRLGSMGEAAISYDDLVKPGMSTVEVQPDMRTLDLRGNHRGGFMSYGQTQSRRFGPQGQFDGQRRLIPLPEEEGRATPN